MFRYLTSQTSWRPGRTQLDVEVTLEAQRSEFLELRYASRGIYFPNIPGSNDGWGKNEELSKGKKREKGGKG